MNIILDTAFTEMVIYRKVKGNGDVKTDSCAFCLHSLRILAHDCIKIAFAKLILRNYSEGIDLSRIANIILMHPGDLDYEQ